LKRLKAAVGRAHRAEAAVLMRVAKVRTSKIKLTIKIKARGFTLVEIMIVVAIMAIVMAVGIPSMYRALQKDDLARAMNDTIEGCKMARDRAILQGVTYQFVVKSEGGELNVLPAPPKAVRRSPDEPEETASTPKTDSSTAGSTYAAFPRKLGEDIKVELVDVNFVDLMQAPEAVVKFYPNGTSDEFTIVYGLGGKQRTVMVDIVTGLASEYKKE